MDGPENEMEGINKQQKEKIRTYITALKTA